MFDKNWMFLGIQITDRSCINEVYSSTEILRSLKRLEYKPIIVNLIQSIEPLPNIAKNYEDLLLIPGIITDRVYGLNLSKDYLVSYHIKSFQSTSIPLKEKLSEGVSLTLLPNGVFLSGGRNSLRKG